MILIFYKETPNYELDNFRRKAPPYEVLKPDPVWQPIHTRRLYARIYPFYKEKNQTTPCFTVSMTRVTSQNRFDHTKINGGEDELLVIPRVPAQQIFRLGTDAAGMRHVA